MAAGVAGGPRGSGDSGAWEKVGGVAGGASALAG